VIGASAFPEIHELIKDINIITESYELIGILDDNTELLGTEIEGIPVIGKLDKASEYPENVKFIFGIGSYKSRLDRSQILERLNLPDERYETIIHPTAKVYRSATIGNGVIIYPGSIVFNGSQVDSFCIIVANSIVGARNILGRGCLLTSLVSLTSDVKVGSFSFIGTHSSVAEGVEIGPGSMIGMRSFVVRNVLPGSVVMGNPMKIINKIEVPKKIIDEWVETSKNLESK